LIDEFLFAVNKILKDYGKAVTLTRRICRDFGGWGFYATSSPTQGVSSAVFYTIKDIIGSDDISLLIYNELRNLFFKDKIYIPKEINVFRKELAQDIYIAYDGTGENLIALMNKYKISAKTIYRLYHEERSSRINYVR